MFQCCAEVSSRAWTVLVVAECLQNTVKTCTVMKLFQLIAPIPFLGCKNVH